MLKNLGAWALATSMLVSGSAYAAGSTDQGALSRGMSANLKQAQSLDGQTPLCLLVGAGVVIGGIALIASGNGHGSIGSTTTCPFSGCPVPPPPPPPTTTTTTPTTTTTRPPRQPTTTTTH